ncbi:MAG: hypothetical protein ACO201_02165 [Rickettsiales bacterium]
MNKEYDSYLTKKEEDKKKDQKRMLSKDIEGTSSLYYKKKKNLEQIIDSKINNFVDKVFSHNPHHNYDVFKFFRINNLKFVHGAENIEKNKSKLKEFLKAKYPSVQDVELGGKSIEDQSQLDQLSKEKNTIIKQHSTKIDSISASIDKEWDKSLEELEKDRHKQVFSYARSLLQIKTCEDQYKGKIELFFQKKIKEIWRKSLRKNL